MDVVSSTPAAQRLTARQPLVRDVYDVLVDMFMNHTFAPGERLNIDALARTLGVSQTPIREAMARLEAEGLILKEPRRSYTVAPLITLDELRALIDLRLLVEPAAAAAAEAMRLHLTTAMKRIDDVFAQPQRTADLPGVGPGHV